MIVSMRQKNKQKNIAVISPNCTGCRLCSLACSFLLTEAFSLSEARIKVMRVGNTNNFMVSFADDCMQCGECAKYCYYNVLGFL